MPGPLADTSRLRPRRAPAVLLLAAGALGLAVVLGACASPGDASAGAGGDPAARRTTVPSSTPTPASGDLVEGDGAPSVAWTHEGRTVAVTTWGSSTCPVPVGSLVADGTDGLVVTLGSADPGPCTMDYVPSTTVVDLPEDVADRPVAVSIVSADGDEVGTATLE